MGKPIFKLAMSLCLVALLSVPAVAQMKPWGVIADATQRFQVLSSFNNEAVLDRVTGLIWQKSPISGSFSGLAAPYNCNTRVHGGQMGFRLPKIEELTSLVEVGPASSVELPANHPFENVQTGSSNCYWSYSHATDDHDKLLCLTFGSPGGIDTVSQSTMSRPFWCVRGGSNQD